MDIAVVGNRAEVPEEVRAVAQVKVAKVARHTPVLDRAQIRLREMPDAPANARRVCEVTMTGHGHTIRAKASAHDLTVAVDLVVDKLEHQAERMKGKILARHHPRRSRMPDRGAAVARAS